MKGVCSHRVLEHAPSSQGFGNKHVLGCLLLRIALGLGSKPFCSWWLIKIKQTKKEAKN